MKKLLLLFLFCAATLGAMAQTTYYECSWNGSQVVRTELTTSGRVDDISTAKYASGGGLIGEDYDYFVATKSCTIRNGLEVTGDCKLILCDGVTVTVEPDGGSGGIKVARGNSLKIYAQSQGSNAGKLIVKVDPKVFRAGIGGYTHPDYVDAGTVEIHGGYVEAHGGMKSAGIGGTEKRFACARLTIFDGTVKAYGGENGAGLGGGSEATGGVDISIFGGDVYAEGGKYGAGIGVGYRTSAGGKLHICGGKVTAKGGAYGAGIGGGQSSFGLDVTVDGGHVDAYGGTDAAGIGTGENLYGGGLKGRKLTVNGGYVFADGTGWGAGIGGGEDAIGAEVVINGGTVIAWAGADAGEKNGCAIGSEDGDGYRGSLKIGDQMMVHAGQDPGDANGHLFSYGERVPACYFRPYCRVEVCNHEGHTYTINGTGANDTHTLRCPHCLDRTEEKHTFEGGKCSVCGAAGSAFDVKVYLPNTSGSGYGSPQTFNIAANKEFLLPSAPEDKEPAGMTFAGWVRSETAPTRLSAYTAYDDETLLPADSKITVNNTTYLVARYKHTILSLSNDQDNSDILIAYDNKKASSVVLSGRTLYKDGSWNTLCLPFDVTIAGSALDGDGVVVKTLESSSYSNETLKLNFADVTGTITAGTPFLIKWTTGTDIVNPEFNNVTINNNLNDISTDYIAFIGNFSPVSVYQEDAKTRLYMGDNNTLYYATSEDVKVNACRGHFLLKGNLVAGGNISSEQSAAKAFDLDFGDDVTAINGIQQPAATAQQSDWYTLDGRRLSGIPTTKGIYIHDGKKFVIN